jgi:hypothetical protein
MRNLFIAAAVLATAAGLGGCTGTVEKLSVPAAVAVMSNPQTAALTIADIQSARDSAERWNDAIALQCYDYLLVRLPELGLRGRTDIKGAVSTFQAARNAVKASQEGFSDAFLSACGPLYLDARSDVRGIVSMFAGVGIGL